MKGLFVILLLVFFCSAIKAQSSLSLVPDTFSATAQLVEEPGHFAACGIIAFAFVLQFDAVKTLFNNNHLKIIVLCPDFYGNNFFVKGRQYRLTLSKDMSLAHGYTTVPLPKNYDKKSWFVLEKAILLD